MSDYEAKRLWDAILAFAQAQWNLGKQNNEFCSQEEQAELEVEEKVARANLQKSFHLLTDWFPMCDEHFTMASIKPMEWQLVRISD